MPQLVTATIPAYNYSKFVCRAVDSVLAQDYPSIECVVVDDGSTDNTMEVLKGYGDQIRVISQTNAGLSAARNTGIREANGEFVAFLDADDFWQPQKITRQVELMNRVPALMAVGCGWDAVDGDLKVLSHRMPGRPTGNLSVDLPGIACRKIWLGGSGSGVMARKEVFDSVGKFDTSLKAAEDIDMWLRIASRFPVDNVYEMLTTLVYHGTGSFRSAVKMYENQMLVHHKAIAAWPDIFTEPVRRKYRAVIEGDAGGEYVGAGQLREAHAAFVRALRLDPTVKRWWGHYLRLSAKRLLGRT